MKESLHKIIFSGILAACLLAAFSACKYEGDVINVIKNAAYEENKNFETRGIPLLHGDDSTVANTVYTRFYNQDEYIPYVGLLYWFKNFTDVKVTSCSYSDGEYSIMTESKDKIFPLLVNHKNSTIYCPKWVGFNEPDPTFSFPDNKKLLYLQKTFIGQKAVVFDLAKYGFKIYAGLDDVYIPLYVVSQFFTCTTIEMQLLYNGKNIYFYGSDSYSTFKDTPWYTDSQGKVTSRPQKLIDINYNMLCMTHDYLYGQPGYYGFADDGKGYAKEDIVSQADKLSFDSMLTQYEPEIKSLLKSSAYSEYLKGLKKLVLYTYGDEHANANWKNGDSYLTFNDPEIKQALASVDTSGKWKYDNTVSEKLHDYRQKAGIENIIGEIIKEREVELIDEGKSLIIRFDEFTLDVEGWQSYYKSLPSAAVISPDPETVTLPDDTIGLFYKTFYKIQKDKTAASGDYKNVKTVLIDDSLNGGGEKYVLQWLLSLITGKGDLSYDDAHTGTKYHEYVKADLNLDGKVNSKDDEYCKKFEDLNIAILCSFYSFSCGNALPFIAKERGIKILGERSGGGSCVVGACVTADGYPFNISFKMRICNETFSKTVEGGAEPDKVLDYSKFYDNPSLISALKEVFPDTY